MMARWQEEENAGALAIALANYVSIILNDAIDARGTASLVVSGGSTPAPFFNALNTHSLPWEKLWVTLADERWVNTDLPDSNEWLVRETLLAGKKANFVGLKTNAATPQEGAAEVEKRLSTIPQPYDVVILGMGGDGHTASLFPRAPELKEALETDARVMAITPPNYAPHLRITQTLSALLNSQHVIVHITGEKKRALLEEADKPGDCLTLPVRAIVQQTQVPVDVYYAP